MTNVWITVVCVLGFSACAGNDETSCPADDPTTSLSHLVDSHFGLKSMRT